MVKAWMTAALVGALLGFSLVGISRGVSAENVGNLQSGREGNFSASSRQEDLVRLRNFVYPQGFSDQTIVSLENGTVPEDLTVGDYARLHCGESTRMVLHPCIVRYGERGKHAYLVVTQDGNMSFVDLASATGYYRSRVTETTSALAQEIDTINVFVDEFCAEIAAGARPADILMARGGDRPRIHHPIAPPNPKYKYQFSDLFSWARCVDCVGIIAVNQPEEAPAPTCGALRKQSVPHISYFVVDKITSKGHRSIDDGIAEFTRIANNTKR